MRDEYDFSGGERGKFYCKDAVLIPPVHIDREILVFLAERAKVKGTTLNSMLNELLKKHVELIRISS